MHRLNLLIILILSMMACGFSQEKHYVTPENLQIEEEGIFVCVENEWFATDALFSNAQGMYVECLWFPGLGYDCPDHYKPCFNCKRCIHNKAACCQFCGEEQ